MYVVNVVLDVVLFSFLLMCVAVRVKLTLIMKRLYVTASEASGEEDTADELPPTTCDPTILWHAKPQPVCGNISPSPSSSSNEDSTQNNTLQFALDSSALNDLFAPIDKIALNRKICNDLRVSANKSFSQNIRPARPYLPPRRSDGYSSFDYPNAFEKRINRLSEKRQSDPQIRYAFYNKGFEVATSTKHRKYSLSQFEVRRKAMPDIDEYGSMEHEKNEENDESSDEWQGSRQKLQYYSGSSGRDITLLPKLKIRICDEMGARIRNSFDESSFSDENFNETDPVAPADRCEHKDPSSAKPSAQIDNDDNDRAPEVCKKCGHKRTLQKQFTNAFV